MSRTLNQFINCLLWAYFGLTSFILFFGAVLVWLITLPFDPNKKILQKYSCFWSSIYIWGNPFWFCKTLGKKNVDPKKVYVMVSNHESLMDILVMFYTFLHFKWVSKASMFKAPILGWNMWLNGYIPIERGDAESRERCLDKCRRWIQKGSSIFFFPEGTRSKDGVMRPFKLGAFRLAIESGVDILPLIIRGTRNAVPKHSLRLTRKSKMSVEILPAISTKGFDLNRLSDEAKRLADYVYDQMQSALGQGQAIAIPA